MRRLWPLTIRGTGALVLAVGCLIAAHELGVAELVYFGVLLLAAVAVAILSLYLTRRTDAVTRSTHPETASVGGGARVVVEVALRTAIPTAPGTWDDTLPPGLDGAARGAFPAVGSGLRGAQRSVSLSYDVIGTRRGVHEIGPLAVTSTDPFGLARRRTVHGERTAVTVAPAILELSGLTDVAGAAGGTRQTVDLHLGQGADNLVARPYQPGDSMRRIHWRATAHRDELMVRQEEQESTPEAIVVFDLGMLRWSADAMREPGADPAFETAVSSCVSVVARLVHDGYAVEVVDSDGTPLAERIEGGEVNEIDTLATRFATLTARAEDHLARLSPLLTGTTTGPLVLIVGRFDPVDVAAIAAVAHHSTHPLLLAAAPRDDALDRAADAGWHTGALVSEADLEIAWSSAGERADARVG